MRLASALRILEMRETSVAPQIRFHYLVPARLPAGRVKAAITRLFKDFGKVPASVNYVFCSDDYLLSLNREYLKHNYYTDVVTFDLSEDSRRVVADVFISIDRVRDNADGLGIPHSKELLRVIIHGALHLVGLTDKTRADKATMRQAEDKYLGYLSIVPRETKAKKKFHVKHGKGVS